MVGFYSVLSLMMNGAMNMKQYIVCTTQLLIRHQRSSLLSLTFNPLPIKQITNCGVNLNCILVTWSFPPTRIHSTSFIQVRN
jgi:hypothetical protein